MTDDPLPILVTPDGSRTALSARFGEAYGSRHGAAGQAEHVFLRGSGTDRHPAPRVLEVGFGLGLNFRTTLADVRRRAVPLQYVAFEFDPAPAAVLRDVAVGADGGDDPAWSALLAQWPDAAPGGALRVRAGQVDLTVHFADVLTTPLPRGWATALYLDGFSPARNPEVWTPAFTAQLARALAPGGVLSTYSAAGHVRRALQAAGLRVERRPGPPGKREYLSATLDSPTP